MDARRAPRARRGAACTRRPAGGARRGAGGGPARGGAEVGADAVHCSEETTGFDARATTGWRGARRRAARAASRVSTSRGSARSRKGGRPYDVYSAVPASLDAAGAPPGRAGATERSSCRRGAKIGRYAPRWRRSGFDGPPDARGSSTGLGGRGPERGGALGALGVRGYGTGRNVLGRRHLADCRYLRFGTLSPLWLEQRVRAAGGRGAEVYRSELAWRDFYAAVLLHHPEAARRSSRSATAARCEWDDDPDALAAWKARRDRLSGRGRRHAQLRAWAGCTTARG